MKGVIVAGIGTDVGKTVVSAILAAGLGGEYWKPIQCGNGSEGDTEAVRVLLEDTGCVIHPAVYHFKDPLSPIQAAARAHATIDPAKLHLPAARRPLVIEGVGGVLVPLTPQLLAIDLFKEWQCPAVIVSKHYLGSINHTLLTVEALKRRCIPILGLIFNGGFNAEIEQIISKVTGLPVIATLPAEGMINKHTIRRYSTLWHSQIQQLLH